MLEENGTKKKSKICLSIESQKLHLGSLETENRDKEVDEIIEPEPVKEKKTGAFDNKELSNKLEKLERNITNLRNQFNEEIENTKKIIQDINISRVNEIYSSIDLWISDVSEETGAMSDLANEITYLLQNREKIRGKPGMTGEDYIAYLIKIMAELRLKIYEIIPLLKEKTLSADEVKRKINILLS